LAKQSTVILLQDRRFVAAKKRETGRDVKTEEKKNIG